MNDLEEAIKVVKKDPPTDGTMVALYGESSTTQRTGHELTRSGVGQTTAGPYVVDELAKTYLDVLYE